jgi:hypothetical protein
MMAKIIGPTDIANKNPRVIPVIMASSIVQFC